MSLRLRVALTFASVMAVVVSTFGLILYVIMGHELEAEMDRRLRVRASQVQLTLWPSPAALSLAALTTTDLDLTPLDALNAPNISVQILDQQGQILSRSENLDQSPLPVEPRTLAAALAGESVLSQVRAPHGDPVRVLSSPLIVDHEIVGVLQVGQSRLPLQETLAELARLLQALGILSLAAAGGVGWIVADRSLRDLILIARQAALITQTRDFRMRIQVRQGNDEVAQLAHTIDDLLVTIDSSNRLHRQFVSDTSHELRNPLLALQTNLDLLEQVEESQARAECLAEAQLQVQRMTRLVSDLLMLAQREARLVVEYRPTPLHLLVEHMAREAQHRTQGQQIRLGRLDEVTILGDEARLAQVLTNLVENAIKHTPPDGIIELSVTQVDDQVELVVADNGEGVGAEHLPHLFERFYRVPHTGSSADQSTGLGLAIVKHLAEAHGGQVMVESAPGQGSRFTVRLPLPPGLPAAPDDDDGDPRPKPVQALPRERPLAPLPPAN